ncbi:DDT domain-containing protein DDR4 [Carica papaya]|uniref:DDT domain-containing protein DDR4 n=1 Tax=Carica papaya TaxID=3649 RepID=UPI000B8D0BD3|nr:DDT domain-containing protein DDR4 [Carica papaya]
MSGEGALLEEEIRNDSFIVFDHESEVQKLRGRWELASVLNFLSVFEPVLGNDFNLTAEEIEMGLIEANNSNTQLHIALLKGIPPVSKTLDRPDVWVTVLCKKLSEWWPWVAYGDIPLTAGNGEEVYKYRELDPTCRLLILKALCEIRVDQDDTVSYINDSLKQKTKLPSFRKEKLGEHANGTSYWYDGNAILGYRLYKEISKMNSLRKMRGKACSNLPVIYSHWETVATNLEEFQKVSTELLSSKAFLEIAIGKTVETDAIPVVKNFQKKKERALKRKKREEMLLSDLRNSSGAVRTTRSCRSRRPISYTFDEYDRAINEAIQLRKETSTEEKQKWYF